MKLYLRGLAELTKPMVSHRNLTEFKGLWNMRKKNDAFINRKFQSNALE